MAPLGLPASYTPPPAFFAGVIALVDGERSIAAIAAAMAQGRALSEADPRTAVAAVLEKLTDLGRE